MSLDVYETGDTRQFTFTSSVAPDSAPILKVAGILGTVVASISSTQSDTTHYYALYTMPTSEGYYQGEWFALKTTGSSAYQYIRRFNFMVNLTDRP